MLTISQLARYSGVTVRAVRHYHQCGLLPEPDRDASGYRRYDAGAVVELIRIRTLAEAGVPLARVRELLDAGEDEFTAALVDVDRELRARIRELQQHRRRVAELGTGEALVLPREVIAFLDMFREAGISERGIAVERDAWIMVSASFPDQIVTWINQKVDDFARHPELMKVYQDFDRCFDWSPDDPRLVGIADDFAALVAKLWTEYDPDHEGPQDGPLDEPLAAVMDAATINAAPAWRRIGELLEERGWSGWTNIAPTDNALGNQ